MSNTNIPSYLFTSQGNFEKPLPKNTNLVESIFNGNNASSKTLEQICYDMHDAFSFVDPWYFLT